MSAAALCAAAYVLPLLAQQRPTRPQVEARLDAIIAPQSVAHVGVGVGLPLGSNLRLALVGAVGAAVSGPERGASARVEAVARFLLDPYLESRWGWYAGGGVGGRFDPSDRRRAVLIAAVGVEGTPRRGVVPFAEIGYGGGVRLGVGVRRAAAGRR